jgi:hypothetical protein
MQSVRWSGLLLLPLVAACERSVAPVFADGAQQFLAPPVYQLWWAMAQECSGRRGPLSAVHWYVVPGAETVAINGERYEGYWSSTGNSIVLAEAATLDGPLVRHEMLHALLGDAGHRREEFLGRCGGVVECNERCVTDAGSLPPVDASVPRVAPDVLEVDVVVSSAAPSPARDGGYFTMTVTVHNPWPNAVVARLPPSEDGGPSVTYQYEFARGGGAGRFSDRALDDGVTRFAAGETKRRVYDFHIIREGEASVDGGLQPGTYQFRAAYATNWAVASPTVTLPSP